MTVKTALKMYEINFGLLNFLEMIESNLDQVPSSWVQSIQCHDAYGLKIITLICHRLNAKYNRMIQILSQAGIDVRLKS